MMAVHDQSQSSTAVTTTFIAMASEAHHHQHYDRHVIITLAMPTTAEAGHRHCSNHGDDVAWYCIPSIRLCWAAAMALLITPMALVVAVELMLRPVIDIFLVHMSFVPVSGRKHQRRPSSSGGGLGPQLGGRNVSPLQVWTMFSLSVEVTGPSSGALPPS